MNKYFIQLFLQENTIILPGFGALTAPNGNVEEIMFMPYLKTDDGKLADFIVETEGIDRQDAQNTIAKFIREMEANLSKGESFDIFQFGSFFKNESGEIEFKSWMKEKPEGEKREEAFVAPIKDEIIASEPIEEIESIEENSESIPHEVEVTLNEVLKNAQNQEDIKKEEPTVVATNADEGQVHIIPAPIIEKEKKRKTPVWLISFAIIALIAASVYYFWDRPTKKVGEKIARTDEQNQENESDSLKGTVSPEDEVQTPIPENKTPIEEPQKVDPESGSDMEVLPEDSKGFFLIGGLYSNLEVAKNKVKTAKSDGMNAKVLMQGKGKMYVSLDDFTNMSDANKRIVTLREKGIKVWVLKK